MKLIPLAILFLASVVSTFGNTQTSKEVAITRSNVAELQMAVEVYRSAYSAYPPLEEKALLTALKGKKDEVNPKGLPFWSPKKEKKTLWWTSSHGVVNSNGELIDGWGNRFHWSVSPDGQSLRLTSKGKNGVLDAGKSDGDDLYFTVVETQPKESIKAE